MTSELSALLADVENTVAGLDCQVEDRMTLLGKVQRIVSLVTEMENAKDQAYLERNHLVAALARLYPSGIRRTNIEGWSDDWNGCCLIDLPSGQISYHFHDSQAGLFAKLPRYTKPWDGHDKHTVHERLASNVAGRITAPERTGAAEVARTSVPATPITRRT